MKQSTKIYLPRLTSSVIIIRSIHYRVKVTGRLVIALDHKRGRSIILRGPGQMTNVMRGKGQVRLITVLQDIHREHRIICRGVMKVRFIFIHTGHMRENQYLHNIEHKQINYWIFI